MNEEFTLLSNEETLEKIKQAQSGSEEAKEFLINKNFPLIKSIVKRFVNFGVDYEDLYQLGCVGFLKAVANFNVKLNVKFSTYAVPMIAGEIKRFLRDDGEIKVSRSVKTLSSKIKQYIYSYKKLQNVTPSIEEIAKNFNVSQEDVVFAMDSTRATLSLYDKDSSDDDGLSLVDKISGGESLEGLLDSFILKDALMSLDKKEKQIIMLRFYRGATQSEVATMLDISQVQVSRLEAKIIAKLKSYF